MITDQEKDKVQSRSQKHEFQLNRYQVLLKRHQINSHINLCLYLSTMYVHCTIVHRCFSLTGNNYCGPSLSTAILRILKLRFKI